MGLAAHSAAVVLASRLNEKWIVRPHAALLDVPAVAHGELLDGGGFDTLAGRQQSIPARATTIKGDDHVEKS